MTEASSPAPRRVLIDALNLAYWCGPPPSLRLPLALMTQLLAEGAEALLVFDAGARHQLPHEAAHYAELMQHPHHCIEVSSGRTADGVLLRLARANGAGIVSRDHYGDHRRRYRKLIDDPTRLLPGFVKDEQLHLPNLDLRLPLPPSASAALLALQAQWATAPAMSLPAWLKAAA